MIKIGIVGTGGMAHSHAKAFQQIPGCRLVAACDVIRARARSFAERYDIPGVYADAEEMLDDA
nr:Gfo/Idh/MocA family oxidoreductase [Gemmatimonadales bacterium]